ncbi:MAG: hypothetical protein ACLFQ8_01125 [Candidatus Aenigmatarchaeota archaeon]
MSSEISIDDYKKVLELGQEELKEYIEDPSGIYLPAEIIAAGVKGESIEEVKEGLDELVEKGEVEKAEVLKNPVKVSDKEYGITGPLMHLQTHPESFMKTTEAYRLTDE